MEDKLLEILGLLEKDLKDIDSAVKHLSKSQEAAQSLVDSNMEFAKSFRAHMEVLQNEIKSLLKALKTDSDAIIAKWETLSEGLSNMADRLSRLTTYFESVNFPARLDKIDASISTIQLGLQSNQNLLNELYRKLDQNSEKQREYHGRSMKQIRFIKTTSLILLGIVIIGTAISVAGLVF